MVTVITFLCMSAFLVVLAPQTCLGDFSEECCPQGCVCHTDSKSVTCHNLQAFPKLCNGTEIVTIRNSVIRTLLERDKLPVSVRHLTVQGSQTTSIEEGFFPRDSELTILSLDKNDIQEVGQNCLKNTRKLVNLDLSSNRISKLGRLPTTIRLTDLKLNGNRMHDSEVTSALCEMDRSSLRNLHLDDMSLKAIPRGIIDCKDETKRPLPLSFLSAAKNMIIKIPNMSSVKLSKLCLASNQIRDVPRDVLPLSLTYLVIANNPLSANSLSSISKLTNLKHLDLASVNYKRFPVEMFHLLSELEFLSLMKCNITKLTIPMKALASLKSVSLQSNHLKHIPVKELTPLMKLENLFLDHNKISYIDQTDKTEQFLYHLKKLSVSHNPIYCDCPILWFSKWIRSRYRVTEILNQESTQCLAPHKGLPLRELDLNDCDKGKVQIEITLAAVASMLIVGVIIGILLCCCRQKGEELKSIKAKAINGYHAI